MTQFDDYIFDQARKGIAGIDDEIASEIYALSFYYWADEDDPRRATLTVGYNTNTRWRSCSPEPGQNPGCPTASDVNEAKWNFAFWLQADGTAGVIGEAPEDSKARIEWINAMGLWYSDQEEEDDFDRTLDLGSQIMDRFVQCCVVVAKRLHDEDAIIDKFGRPLPILVHELEYYEAIAEATKQANPPGVADEFVDWIQNL
jgi:hypothetical protein